MKESINELINKSKKWNVYADSEKYGKIMPA